MGAGGTGRYNGMVRATESIFDRDMSGHQIDQRRRDEERADAACSTLIHQLIGLHDGIQSANARTDHNACTVLRFAILGHPARILNSKLCRDDAKLDEPVLAALFARVDEGVKVEPAFDIGARHLAGDLAGDIIDLKTGYAADAGLAGKYPRPIVVPNT